MRKTADNTRRLAALANDNILPLIARLALPTIVGVSVSALYQILNAFFIGRLGTQAIAAMALTFPFAIAVSCIGLCFGTGVASFISRFLGSEDRDKASRYAFSAIASGVVCAILLSVFIEFFSLQIFSGMGAANETLILSQRYLRWLLVGYVLVVLNMTAGFIVRAEGNTPFSMHTQLVAFICNAIFDPIFIFYFDFGIEGAGIATLIGQCVSVAMYIMHFCSGRSVINLKAGFTNGKELGAIVRVGFPAAINSLLQVISISCLNRIAMNYGDTVVAGVGIASRLLMVASLPLNGLCMGSQAIIGYNLGAKKIQRVHEVVKTLALFACGMAAIYTGVCFLFSRSMAAFFSTDPQVIDVASLAIVIFHISMPFIALQQVCLMYFQSIGIIKTALYISLLRYILLTVPLLLILSWLWGITGIYYSLPLADILTGIVCIAVLRAQLSQLRMQWRQAY
ncbi:MATE family efflux transporter [Brenneria populi]|uniref:Multidrug export protein MepA n=1 Tax=Brenneria populi TaxID=1505588 RepID=A0ABU6JLG5_9GAMM|nr:MATE family efflux transporter [Brenneria populi Li et al. 2015]